MHSCTVAPRRNPATRKRHLATPSYGVPPAGAMCADPEQRPEQELNLDEEHERGASKILCRWYLLN